MNKIEEQILNVLSSLLVIAYPGMFALSKSPDIFALKVFFEVIFGLLLCKRRMSKRKITVQTARVPLSSQRSVDMTDIEADLPSADISTDQTGCIDSPREL